MITIDALQPRSAGGLPLGNETILAPVENFIESADAEYVMLG